MPALGSDIMIMFKYKVNLMMNLINRQKLLIINILQKELIRKDDPNGPNLTVR